MTTESQRNAMKKYYETHRQQRCMAMRERNAKRAAERAAYLEDHPEEVEAEKEKKSEQYYNAVSRANRRRINGWLEDERICPAFKTFLRSCVLPTVDKGLPKKLLDLCWNYCAIVSPKNTNEIVDAPRGTKEAETQTEESQAP